MARLTRQQATEDASRAAAERQMQWQKFSNEAEIEATQARNLIPVGMAPAEKRKREAVVDERMHAKKYGYLKDWSEGAPTDTESVRVGQMAVQQFENHSRAARGAALANEQFDQSNRLIGKNMLQNIAHVSTWAASVGVLYGGIHLLTRSLEENIAVARQQAILSQIFKGTHTEVQALTASVLELAAVNGQSAKEAMESATEFARIYHTQREILVATNAALVMANVSGQEAAKTTEFLSMATQVYRLRAYELAGVVGQIAAISQTYNVTNMGLQKGLEATAEAAKEAGMSMSQLMGIISGGISATQQSGTSIGNTVKTMITQMANPEIQSKLLSKGVDVTEQGYGIKEMPEIYREMYVAYEKMNEAQRRSLLFEVGGRQNATRMAAILDNYVKGQMVAINAQLNLNAAEQENEKIMGTLGAQTKALAAEWDRFVKIQGDRGPMDVLTNMAEGLKNIIRLANAPGVNMMVTLLGAMGLAAGAKTLLTGYAMTGAKAEEMGVKGGILMSTAGAIKKATADLDLWYAATISNQRATMGFAGALVQASYGMGALGSASRLTLASLAGLRTMLPVIAAYLAVVTANKYVRMFGGPDQMENLESGISTAKARAAAYQDRGSLYSTASSMLNDPRVSTEDKATLLQQLAPDAAMGRTMQGMLMGGRSGDIAEYYASRSKSSSEDSRKETEKQLGLLRQKLFLQQNEGTDPFEQGLSGGSRWGMFKNRMGIAFRGMERDLTFASGDSQQAEQIERQRNIDATMADIREAQRKLVEAKRVEGPGFEQERTSERFESLFPQAVTSGIGAQFGTLPTATPLDVHHREMAQAQAEYDFRSKRFEEIKARIASPGIGAVELQTLQNFALPEARAAFIEAGAALRTQRDPALEAQRQNQTRLGVYGGIAQAEYASMGVGLTEGEQMVAQYRGAEKRKGEYEGLRRVGGDWDQAAEVGAMTMQVQMTETRIKAEEKILEIRREQANLAKQEQMAFERSLLTAGPGELLRKLAVSRMEQRGPMNAGRFFAMSSEARQEWLSLPGHSMRDIELRRSRSALERQFGRVDPNDPGSRQSHMVWAGRAAIAGSVGADSYGRAASLPDMASYALAVGQNTGALRDLTTQVSALRVAISGGGGTVATPSVMMGAPPGQAAAQMGPVPSPGQLSALRNQAATGFRHVY